MTLPDFILVLRLTNDKDGMI